MSNVIIGVRKKPCKILKQEIKEAIKIKVCYGSNSFDIFCFKYIEDGDFIHLRDIKGTYLKINLKFVVCISKVNSIILKTDITEWRNQVIGRCVSCIETIVYYSETMHNIEFSDKFMSKEDDNLSRIFLDIELKERL